MLKRDALRSYPVVRIVKTSQICFMHMECEGINDTCKEATVIVEGLLDREIEG